MRPAMQLSAGAAALAVVASGYFAVMRMLGQLASTAATVLTAGVFLAASGCPVLSGQRFTLRHDAAHDELAVLVAYDGIHHRVAPGKAATDAELAESAQKVARFARDEDVMLADWFGHAQRASVRSAAESESTTPAARALARGFLASVRSELVGHHRDAFGRLGATQLVVIAGARELLTLANRALDEAVLRELAEHGDRDPEYAGTWARWHEAASRQHAWLALDGHSFVIDVPIHDGEWQRAKLEFFTEAIDELCKAATGNSEAARHVRAAVAEFLARAPLSITQTEDRVTARIGFASRPEPVRLVLYDGYTPNLEAAVRKAAPRDLDAALAQRLLGEPTDGDPAGMRAIVEWGPPELRATAVLHALESDASNAKALAWLTEFGARWNRAGGVLRAPEPSADREDTIKSWRAWCRAMQGDPAAH